MKTAFARGYPEAARHPQRPGGGAKGRDLLGLLEKHLWPVHRAERRADLCRVQRLLCKCGFGAALLAVFNAVVGL